MPSEPAINSAKFTKNPYIFVTALNFIEIYILDEIFVLIITILFSFKMICYKCGLKINDKRIQKEKKTLFFYVRFLLSLFKLYKIFIFNSI